jgi:hypothetical protein
MKRRDLVVLAIGLAALTALIAWLIPRGDGTQTRQTADLPGLVREIQALNELITVKYKVQKVVGMEEQKAPLGVEKLLLIVQADVLAGVDLNQLKATDLRRMGQNQVAVNLPAARVLHVVLDEKKTKVWDRQVTWWTPWVPFSPDLESKARQAATESIRSDAVEMGILTQAKENAEGSIRRLLRSLGIQAVNLGS